MRMVFLFILAIGLGFLTAIPVGGSQIEVAKRAILGHLRSAGMVILGSVSSDVMYGAISLYGLAPFLQVRWVMAAFNAVGAVVLWGLAFVTLRQSRKPPQLELEHALLRRRRRAYFTGFLLAVTNPQMILTWLYGVVLAKHLGLANPLTGASKAVFIAGGAIGLGGYLTVLALGMLRFKHFIPIRALGKIYYWLGLALVLLSFFFVFNAIRYFAH
ncbi:MAG: LysE family transporter [Candidatus Aminicenantes bacterium]|nr:LysE family transporter [Candidatus Aminicenantes bacterium]